MVNDCYNANHVDAGRPRPPVPGARRAPDSDPRHDGRAGRRLGAFHREIGAHAARAGVDLLVPVGAPALAYLEGFDGEAQAVGTPEEAAALLEELGRPGDRVLVKGSRSVGLERVLS